jgi:hypothetical protein
MIVSAYIWKASVFGEKFQWGDDRNAAKWIQRQQILIAGEDQVGAAIDG